MNVLPTTPDNEWMEYVPKADPSMVSERWVQQLMRLDDVRQEVDPEWAKANDQEIADRLNEALEANSDRHTWALRTPKVLRELRGDLLVEQHPEMLDRVLDKVTTFDFGQGSVPAHQHQNGGGWVADSATVDENAFVGPDAKVFGNACVYCDAQVLGTARVWGEARVHGNALIYNNAQVYADANVCGNAQVYGNAQVFGCAKVSGLAEIFDDAWVYGNAKVFGDAKINGATVIFDDAQVCIDIRELPSDLSVERSTLLRDDQVEEQPSDADVIPFPDREQLREYILSKKCGYWARFYVAESNGMTDCLDWLIKTFRELQVFLRAE